MPRQTTKQSAALYSALGLSILVALLAAARVGGQGFTSGSTGSDGELTLTTAGTYDLSTLGKDSDGDNVYHFTTITVGAGVTLTLSGSRILGPATFLAQGNVVVAGTIDLRGSKGHLVTSPPANRVPSVPGPGGFPGGVGGNSTNPPRPGGGPAGGQAGTGNQNTAGGGGFSGNAFLIPLIGGSGGGGQRRTDQTYGGGGGAGGGAILIASSTSINVTGTITADGGDAGDTNCNCFSVSFGSGAGAGGAIRLVAPTLLGSGALSVRPGQGSFFSAGAGGSVRLEAFQNLSGLTNANGVGTVFRASPTALALMPRATLRVAAIGGIALPVNPSGAFNVPDVVMNTQSAVAVNIEAENIPVGTTVKLHVFSENAPDLIVDAPGLVQGSGALLTTSVNVTFPPGYSRGFVKASYTRQF